MVSLLDEVILPSLSLLPCNSGVAEEVWSMLKLLPYETRYGAHVSEWVGQLWSLQVSVVWLLEEQELWWSSGVSENAYRNIVQSQVHYEVCVHVFVCMFGGLSTTVGLFVVVVMMCRRITKDNVKPSGRLLGKLTHSNPGIVFSYVSLDLSLLLLLLFFFLHQVLSQIQKYDNIIIHVVDSLKYLTPLAYDVLACIHRTFVYLLKI